MRSVPGRLRALEWRSAVAIVAIRQFRQEFRELLLLPRRERREDLLVDPPGGLLSFVQERVPRFRERGSLRPSVGRRRADRHQLALAEVLENHCDSRSIQRRHPAERDLLHRTVHPERGKRGILRRRQVESRTFGQEDANRALMRAPQERRRAVEQTLRFRIRPPTIWVIWLAMVVPRVRQGTLLENLLSPDAKIAAYRRRPKLLESAASGRKLKTNANLTESILR